MHLKKKKKKKTEKKKKKKKNREISIFNGKSIQRRKYEELRQDP